jgi:hypothetical protein
MVDKAKRRTVRHLSLDILYRTPTPSELRMYVGFPVDRVTKRMTATLEAKELWVEEELLYFLLLDNFRPQTTAIKTLPKRMHQGKVSAHDAIVQIMMSTGFTLRNPGNDTFVTVVLEQGLGLRVQDRKNVPTLEAGKKMYDGYKVRFLRQRGNSQSDIIKIVSGQRDFTKFLLNRYHKQIMRVPLPKDKQTKEQVDRVHADNGQFFDVLREWFCSAKYMKNMEVKRPRTDNQFIRSLYFDLLGRAPKYQEFRNMRNALLSMADPAPLRGVMAKVILDSGRAQLPHLDRKSHGKFVQESFLRYLGRAPTQNELAKFTKVLQNERVQAKHVVRALITSTEYQYY